MKESMTITITFCLCVLTSWHNSPIANYKIGANIQIQHTYIHTYIQKREKTHDDDDDDDDDAGGADDNDTWIKTTQTLEKHYWNK
jgi:hypothetical protein